MYTINNVIRITGKGWVISCFVPDSMPVAAGDQIRILGTDEQYTVKATERTRLLTDPPRLSTSIGILIKGELIHDPEFYIGKTLVKRNDSMDIRKLNSITKYPSILTYHQIGKKGRLLPELTDPPAADMPLDIYEKVDGENARIILVRYNEGWDVDYFIGSREDMLHAKGDRIAIPTGNIAEFLRPLADRLCDVFNASYLEYDVMVLYVESYGGNTPKTKQYSSTGAQGYRLFDGFGLGAAQVNDLMTMSLDQISLWRQHGRQPFFSKEEREKIAMEMNLDAAPLFGTIQALPTSIEDTYEFLKTFSQTSVGIDVQGGKSEGVIVRNSDRSIIKKIRFEDYERTLRQ